LTEMPQDWAKAVRRWHQANRRFRQEVSGECVPDANEEYLLYQTLVGSWPLTPMTSEEHAIYVRRIQEYVVKAAHEAKVNSSWMEPNEAWDKGLRDFVERILNPGPKNRFLELFESFATRVAELGALNALSQLALKLTSPGVPDIYQGQELWDLSLVDPDNRRPIDYETRQNSIRNVSENVSCHELLNHWRDGRIKLFVTRTLLHLRIEHPILFRDGSYEALAVEGELADHVISFRRSHENSNLVVIVPRLTLRMGAFPTGASWKDTCLRLPFATSFRDVFTGAVMQPTSDFRLADVLGQFPLAILVTTESEQPG
jgi:(1->4)-alpha-D-glucan 1-alpha-D-glucosylmutase